MGKIKILSARIGENLEVEEMEHSLENMQKIVGGYIEAVRVTDTITLWLNEEGKLNDLEPNFLLIHNGKPYDIVVGDTFFTSVDEEGETVGLSDEEIEEIMDRIELHVTKEGEIVKALNI